MARARKYDYDVIFAELRKGTKASVIDEMVGATRGTSAQIARKYPHARPAQKREPSSPTQSAGLYGPIEGVSEEDAARVRASVAEKVPAKDRADILAMLGLSEVAA